MTAPLPPLPANWFSQMTSSRTVIAPESEIKDFAKLAVRKALERAAVKCDGLPEKTWHEGSDQFGNPCNWQKATTPRDCAQAIRAMLKEYSDD